jgi:Holliday junction DNA helicase RuvA
VIASLNGTVVAIETGNAVVDVSGVGYLVQVTATTSRSLNLSESVTLFTSLVVRDDGFTLFGFRSPSEQKVFDLLRSVTGVGPKSALAILGDLSVDQISDAVSSENDSVFRAVQGVGPKTAKLLILTLSGKLVSSGGNSVSSGAPDLSAVVSALTGLGWNESTASDAASRASRVLGLNAPSNELLKLALANLGASKSVGAADE